MNKLIDWFRLSSQEMCQKYGHKMVEHTYQYYEQTDALNTLSVAERVKVKRKACSRCGHCEPEKELHRTSLQSLSMPGEMWDEMRENGRVII